MAVLEGQPGVGDQVGQTVRTAQQTGLGVVGEAGLGALGGGLQGQGRGGAGLVLCACKGSMVSMSAFPLPSDLSLPLPKVALIAMDSRDDTILSTFMHGWCTQEACQC